jgi:hypothetical protein
VAKSKSTHTARRSPTPRDSTTWPVMWRVVAPRAGSYDQDMVFMETDDETAAREHHRALRRARYPVRLERVHLGPLPKNAVETLTKLRSSNEGPSARLREIRGFWVCGEAASSRPSSGGAA